MNLYQNARFSFILYLNLYQNVQGLVLNITYNHISERQGIVLILHMNLYQYSQGLVYIISQPISERPGSRVHLNLYQNVRVSFTSEPLSKRPGLRF